MADESMPPANLILQALHGIRAAVEKTNERLDKTNERLESLESRVDTTNERLARVEEGLEDLRNETTRGFIQTNTKLAELAKVVDSHERRLDHLLRSGLGAEVRDLSRRVTRLESQRRTKTPPKR